MTHVNLNDNSCAGLVFPKLKLMSLQYHPESSPGPHDSDLGTHFFMLVNIMIVIITSHFSYFDLSTFPAFGEFVELMKANKV